MDTLTGASRNQIEQRHRLTSYQRKLVVYLHADGSISSYLLLYVTHTAACLLVPTSSLRLRHAAPREKLHCWESHSDKMEVRRLFFLRTDTRTRSHRQPAYTGTRLPKKNHAFGAPWRKPNRFKWLNPSLTRRHWLLKGLWGKKETMIFSMLLPGNVRFFERVPHYNYTCTLPACHVRRTCEHLAQNEPEKSHAE